MAAPPVSRAKAKRIIDFVSGALADGFKIKGFPSAITEGWKRYNAVTVPIMDRMTFRHMVGRARELYDLVPNVAQGKKLGPAIRPAKTKDIDAAADDVLYWLRKPNKNGAKSVAELASRTKLSTSDVRRALDYLRERGVNVQRISGGYDIPPQVQQSYVSGHALVINSRPDNTYCFGAFGDLHAGSKHARWDVRGNLVRQAEENDAQAIFDTGNWIDGEFYGNRYDLEVIGLERQCQLLAERHPRTELPIYAVTGDDHEGWYAAREGIDVGTYAEGIMRTAGHDWHNLGFMEAHVILRNVNSGKKATLGIVHPGGGSAYAVSYSVQKIAESYEGGEKPHAAFYGHYHKLWSGVIRNMFVVQTGCQQDQTPFMRKRRLEAHVGGAVVKFKQDPRTGALLSMTPELIRYYNEAFEKGTGRWSHHGPVVQPGRSVKAIRA
jgi:biotin operon repressor